MGVHVPKRFVVVIIAKIKRLSRMSHILDFGLKNYFFSYMKTARHRRTVLICGDFYMFAGSVITSIYIYIIIAISRGTE